jgi:flagellum-specific ATP synthase
MTDITEERHQQDARRFRQVYAVYRQNQDLISVGAYTRGSDPQVDHAIAMHPRLVAFLRQGLNERVPLKDSLGALHALLGAEEASGSERGPSPAPARVAATLAGRR